MSEQDTTSRESGQPENADTSETTTDVVPASPEILTEPSIEKLPLPVDVTTTATTTTQEAETLSEKTDDDTDNETTTQSPDPTESHLPATQTQDQPSTAPTTVEKTQKKDFVSIFHDRMLFVDPHEDPVCADTLRYYKKLTGRLPSSRQDASEDISIEIGQIIAVWDYAIRMVVVAIVNTTPIDDAKWRVWLRPLSKEEQLRHPTFLRWPNPKAAHYLGRNQTLPLRLSVFTIFRAWTPETGGIISAYQREPEKAIQYAVTGVDPFSSFKQPKGRRTTSGFVVATPSSSKIITQKHKKSKTSSESTISATLSDSGVPAPPRRSPRKLDSAKDRIMEGLTREAFGLFSDDEDQMNRGIRRFGVSLEELNRNSDSLSSSQPTLESKLTRVTPPAKAKKASAVVTKEKVPPADVSNVSTSTLDDAPPKPAPKRRGRPPRRVSSSPPHKKQKVAPATNKPPPMVAKDVQPGSLPIAVDPPYDDVMEQDHHIHDLEPVANYIHNNNNNNNNNNNSNNVNNNNNYNNVNNNNNNNNSNNNNINNVNNNNNIRNNNNNNNDNINNRNNSRNQINNNNRNINNNNNNNRNYNDNINNNSSSNFNNGNDNNNGFNQNTQASLDKIIVSFGEYAETMKQQQKSLVQLTERVTSVVESVSESMITNLDTIMSRFQKQQQEQGKFYMEMLQTVTNSQAQTIKAITGQMQSYSATFASNGRLRDRSRREDGDSSDESPPRTKTRESQKRRSSKNKKRD